ncbi:hypothetical protein EV182_003879, partial [Spiromyces aspiralis]
MSAGVTEWPTDPVYKVIYAHLGERTRMMLIVVYVGMALCLLVIATVLYCMRYPHLRGRVSFRLSMSVALSDL